VNAAAVAALHGIPPLAVLETRDPVEGLVLKAVIERTAELERRRSGQMATAIVMGLAHVLFGGRGG
jgi:hypothetical protein